MYKDQQAAPPRHSKSPSATPAAPPAAPVPTPESTVKPANATAQPAHTCFATARPLASISTGVKMTLV
jgi:hypothetical protein